MKADSINGSIVDGIREPVLYKIALDEPPGHKIYKKPRINLKKKIKISVFSHITIFLKHDDHKTVIFSGETISFRCQLVKIQQPNERKHDASQKSNTRPITSNIRKQ